MSKLYTDKNDHWRELLIKARAGDAHAYHQLLEELAQVIRSFTAKRLGGLGLTEDCTQECLMLYKFGAMFLFRVSLKRGLAVVLISCCYV